MMPVAMPAPTWVVLLVGAAVGVFVGLVGTSGSGDDSDAGGGVWAQLAAGAGTALFWRCCRCGSGHCCPMRGRGTWSGGRGCCWAWD